MTKLIFTQDVPGEREWLANQFPGHVNHQTTSSTGWTQEDLACAGNKNIFEISWRDPCHDELYQDNSLQRIKSFFSSDPSLSVDDNCNWALSDIFVSRSQYTEFSNRSNNFYLCLHVGRSGTVFVESLLKQHYSPLQNHIGISPDRQKNLQIVELIRQYQDNLAVALVYSSDLWRNFISTVLAVRYGYHHYDSNFDWSGCASIEISHYDFDNHINTLVYTWSLWCNLRSIFPSLDFYFLDGATMFDRYAKFTNHAPIKYDKKLLISNYSEAEQEFHYKHKTTWQQKLHRIQKHLTNMKCATTLDNIFPINQ
jgi:hypothetical protein